MSYKTGFYEGRLGIGLGSTMGMGDGNPRYSLDINGDIRLTGSIVNGDGQILSLTPPEYTPPDPAGLDANNSLIYNFEKQGTHTGINNILIGKHAGTDLTSGSNNVLLGDMTGMNMTSSGENVFIGSYSGSKLTTGGYHNVGLGYGACGGNGATATNIQNNVCIGQSAGGNLTTGYGNVFVGQYAGLQATTGAHNIAIGKEAGRYKTNKSGYIAIGQEALYSTSGGAQSIAIGYQALKSDVGWNHYDNVAIGYQSMRVVTSGVGNTCLGYVAGQNISSGWYNVLLGKKAGEDINTGYRNICIGMSAGNTLTTTHDSVYIGTEAGQYCDQQNIAIGYQSLRYRCSNYNIAIGYQAMVGTEHTGRAQNVCIGYQTLNPATSATNNVAIGHQAGMRVTSGGYNNIIGFKAGEHTGLGSYNCLFGAYAGRYLTGNNGGGTGNSNVCIGAFSANANTAHVNAMSNSICIGTYAGPKTTESSLTCKLCIGAPGGNNGDTYRGTDGAFIYGDFNSTTLSSRFLRVNGYLGQECSPSYPLEVDGWKQTSAWNGYYVQATTASTSSGSGQMVSIKAKYMMWSTGYIVNSDQRIKTNISEVPDNLSLQKLRDISCCYYEYKDKLGRGSEKTIGFIAQQVKEHMPMAVSIRKNIIPNEMRNLENISWEEITDNSSNQYKLPTDLSDCSGVKYQFFVSNDPSGNDECKKEIIGNKDNTFTFDSSYNNVFCYGKEVDDFHTLDKQKLFALNFSATQELDRKVIALENENAELKAELVAIKQHLGI